MNVAMADNRITDVVIMNIDLRASVVNHLVSKAGSGKRSQSLK